jgi:choline monooxygenase
MISLPDADAFDPTRPITHARTLPASWYHSPEVARLEAVNVFGGTWQMVGRVDSLAESGAFITADIAGEPIIVVRDESGTLRGFFNVCRHKAAVILSEPCGRVSKLRCRYHGWTYDLAGRLRGTPEFEGVCDFDKDDNGLVTLAVDTWGPWVFAHVGPPARALA